MKRNARPSLFDTTVGFDDPLEMLLACHRRIEKQLELSACAPSEHAWMPKSAAAQSVLRYFLKAAATTTKTRKRTFPLLEKRITTRGGALPALREKLERDHCEIGSWARLRKPLVGIAEGLTRSLLAAATCRFSSRPTRATSSPRKRRCRSSSTAGWTLATAPRSGAR